MLIISCYIISFLNELTLYQTSFFSDLGLQQHRLDGDDYLDVVDEFMEAVFTRWPNVIVQVLAVKFKIELVA